MIDQPVVKNSTFVTVVAWIFILISGFMLMISILQNVMWLMIFRSDQMHDALSNAKGDQSFSPSMDFLSHYMWVLFAGFLLVSLITFVAAIGLLKRMNWARIVFIGLMVFGIIWNIGGMAFQFTFFRSFAGALGDASDEFDSATHFMMVAILVMNTVMAIGLTAAFVWIAKRLHSPAIRLEFLQKQA